MATNKLLLALFLCLLSTAALATIARPPLRRSASQQCRLQRLTASQPSHRIDSDGGAAELWDVNEDQFQCVGVAPMRNTLQPNSLSLPNYHSFPRLVFIERGQGIIGVHLPGCAETFNTGSGRRGEEAEQEGGRLREHHQKVHRFRQGDIIAIPAGAVHWTYNDGNEEVVAVSINDLNNPANQLDMQPRSFYLAGGASVQSRHGQQQQQQVNFRNIFSGFDTELLAEAFNVDPEIISQMQRGQERGLIVPVQQRMRFVKPDEQQQGQRYNGLEETMCSSKIIYNLDNQREADIFSRQAGKVNIVNEQKLPILSFLDLGAEKGSLQPNALYTPHWSLNSHTILYALRGEAQIQVVSNNGQNVLNERVKEGDMVVIPQFFASTARAGQNGFEWVVFKTNRAPMNSPLAGYTSVFRAMPLEVITNAYQVSPSQAQKLKTNRGAESFLLSPQTTRS